jgi:hypothetical protein
LAKRGIMKADTASHLSTFRLARTNSEAINQPFTVARFHDVLEEKLYQDLCATFPTPDEHWRETGGLDSKYYIESTSPDFYDIASVGTPWNSFIEAVSDQGFWNDIGILVHPIMVRHKQAGLLSSRLPELIVEAIDERERFLELIKKICQPNLQFSHLRPRDLNSPHSDDWRKLVSIIAYFPPPGWREEFGGGTVFLRAKADLASRPWFDPAMNRVPAEHAKEFFSDMEPFERARYQPNSWVLFCKTINSFHAVEPIKCPPPLARRAFVMTLKISDPETGSLLRD